ncbi:MAG: hypothetical protein LBP63_08320 [Prevotellaceae bacterium]|jgi:hypothetical protein|nr:hypothetical protein [Prevotellaceae bacterium]
MGNLKDKTYEDLVQLHQDGEIGYLQFVLAQENIADVYVGAMHLYGFPQTDETAEQWLKYYEETCLKDDEGAEEEMLNEINTYNYGVKTS